jgi:hypothetical protein
MTDIEIVNSLSLSHAEPGSALDTVEPGTHLRKVMYTVTLLWGETILWVRSIFGSLALPSLS